MKEAKYYHISQNRVVCDLCPHGCSIGEGHYGICGVRKNTEGMLYSETYGLLSAIHFDPVEKKPLYHFHPGTEVLSVGSIGCNMRCTFCQNWQISQKKETEQKRQVPYTPKELIELAKSQKNNIGIAYTYNEPAVGFEFMLDTAGEVKKSGMLNVMVSNGYINEDPLNELIRYIDAFNIDLKAFDDTFYRKQTGASLEPVKKTLQRISKAKRHLEITCLIIPTLNDDEEEFKAMINWIATELGRRTVLHLSKYHPMYKLDIPATETSTMIKFCRLASEKLDFVYAGNIYLKEFQDTYCPECGKLVVSRSGYLTGKQGMNQNGSCAGCGLQIMLN